MSSQTNCTDAFGKHGVEVGVPLTIGWAFDEEIRRARELVETLCIAKAKAEALNLLQQPYQGLRQILGHVI
jgi:hypothetical protein